MTEAFQFKQFTIRHDRCAMKVGTDGVLLGAWANAKGKQRILDIGTGSGLIALMLAQRTDAMITGIEIDPASATQAQENAAASPWADRLQIVATDIAGYTSYQAFDLIVSNPPFFNEMLLPPGAARSQARHTQALTFEALLFHVQRLLSPEGSFCAILPATALTHFSRRRTSLICCAYDICSHDDAESPEKGIGRTSKRSFPNCRRQFCLDGFRR